MAFLDKIAIPSDLKKLKIEELDLLCEEIRAFFIESVLKNGGHFSANLGVVELTLALHYVYDFLNDKIVWDVGHQAYIHKILTGRKHNFNTIRKLNGLSGFPKIDESEFDHFGTGHSSTSISAIMGMAEADLLNDGNATHVAVIGDGSLTGGQAFEALNNLGVSKANVLVIVNDNQMGIDPNLGAISKHLSELDGTHHNIFQNLNLPFQGSVDGHNVKGLIDLFQRQKDLKGPRVLHVKTLKGRGYPPAEQAQTDWHSVSYVKIDPSNKETREVKPLKFQDVFGHTLVEIAEQDERVVGITPAMPSGSSMKFLMEQMPERVFDVGIAEQHAVTFAAGLALNGKRPFCNIYSTFSQRGYDQIIHDVALQKIPVIFCLDRAGMVGEDGPTHHGTFDIAFLKPIPNLVILSPLNEHELRNMMYWALDYDEGPVVIRYPRGRGSKRSYKNEPEAIKIGSARRLTNGSDIAILSVGEIGTEVERCITDNNLENFVAHFDMRWIKPVSIELVKDIFNQFKTIVTVEDGVQSGGFGQEIKNLGFDQKYVGELINLALPDSFIEHGEVSELRMQNGLDANSIYNIIRPFLKS